ncbi:hypothetical protein ACOKWN_002331 [Vibrio parahaemolyticus]
MNFERFMTDTVTLVKVSGEEFSSLKAQVSQKGILMKGDTFIESGDKVVRHMSNGHDEEFVVIDTRFQEKFRSMPAHYNLEVSKVTSLKPVTSNTKTVVNNTYNFNGDNSRVNNNSTDNSTNTVVTDSHDYISQLREEVNRVIAPEAQRREAMQIVDVIEQQLQESLPNKTIVSSMVNSLPALGSLASIGSLIVSALGG